MTTMLRYLRIAALLVVGIGPAWTWAQSESPRYVSPRTQDAVQRKVSSRKNGPKVDPSAPAAASQSTASCPGCMKLTPMPETAIPPPPSQPEADAADSEPITPEPQSIESELQLRTSVTAPRSTIVKQTTRITVNVANGGADFSEPAIVSIELPAHVRLQSAEPSATNQREQTIEFVIAELARDASQAITLDVVPQTAEPIQVAVQVRALETQRCDIGVSRPELVLEATAPEVAFQNGEPLYSVELHNDSPVELTNLRVVAEIPVGLHLTTLNRAAHVDSDQRQITWEFERLGPQDRELLQFQAVARQAGTQTCRIAASSLESEPAELSIATQVDARPNLKVNLLAAEEPIQVRQAAYVELTVENRGTQVAHNVELSVVLPSGLQAAEFGDAQVHGNQLGFSAIELEPGETRTIPLRVTGTEAGEHVVRAELKSASQPTIATEDTVFFYAPSMPLTSSAKSKPARDSE
jgi:hypothetical protein